MAAKIIDGKQVAAGLRLECKARVADLRARTGVTPGLAVVLVGNNPASALYVGNKIKACAEAGLRSFRKQFPADIDAETLIAAIVDLNDDPNVHGILVQLPLPPHIDMRRVLKTIDVAKDVDGFHLYNVGGLVVGDTIFPPCTPYGVVKLLEHENIEVEGRNVVVVGASNIVGSPWRSCSCSAKPP